MGSIFLLFFFLEYVSTGHYIKQVIVTRMVIFLRPIG